jgi:drug/metabolite transporter (DMT)-like permease
VTAENVTATSIALVLGAAVLHATWNALTKRAQDPFAFLWLSMVIAASLLTPPAIALGVAQLERALVPLLASGAIHALYFVTLAAAYRRGDLSVVYPIARGLGVALVPLLASLAIGEDISLLGAIGIAIVALGIATTGLAARPPGGSPPRLAIALALATGVLIAGYSLVDRVGVRRIEHPLPFLVATTWISVLLSAPLARRAALAAEWKANRARIAIASTMNLSGYLLVLFAFRLAPTAYVVAMREVSIAFAAAAGMMLLGEPRSPARAAGAALVVAGVAFVALA